MVLNEVLSLNAQELRYEDVMSVANFRILNEVLSLNAQEYDGGYHMGGAAWSSMKS